MVHIATSAPVERRDDADTPVRRTRREGSPVHLSRTDAAPAKPKTVLTAQCLIWLQFAAIVWLYWLGTNFLVAATTGNSSSQTALSVMTGGGAERWILVLTALAITVSLPVIALRLGRRNAGAVRAAWYALALVPAAMYVWITARAYFATFPDSPEFFIGAAAMLVVCGALPTAALLCLSSRSARTWFTWAEPATAEPEAPAEVKELAGAGSPR